MRESVWVHALETLLLLTECMYSDVTVSIFIQYHNTNHNIIIVISISYTYSTARVITLDIAS